MHLSYCSTVWCGQTGAGCVDLPARCGCAGVRRRRLLAAGNAAHANFPRFSRCQASCAIRARASQGRLESVDVLCFGVFFR